MKEEIKRAFNKLRNNSAPDIDSLESVLFEAYPKIATDQRHVLFTKIWELEAFPNDWHKGLIVKLPKKADRIDSSDWRDITLQSIPSKVFCKIICSGLVVK